MNTPNSQPPTIVHPDSSAVQSYLNLLQGVITRMGANSSNCKSLCITLVSAIAVIITDKNKPNFAWIALLPIVLLSLLDAYYLGLEQGFRTTYNEFVKKMQQNAATPKDLFILIPKLLVKKRDGNEIQPFSPLRATLKAFTSFSIYPFYVTLAAIVLLGRFLVP